MVNFDFATTDHILFGTGRAQELRTLAQRLGTRIALITGSAPDRFPSITNALNTADIQWTTIQQKNEPSITDLNRATTHARAFNADLIIGLGGGSTIDLAKALSVMLTNPGDTLHYLETIGKGQPFTQPALPCIALPTTAGTGAEVTKNAVLYTPQHQTKVSMRHQSMLPDIALIDPALTLTCPPDITAQVGMDALTQIIEPFLSHLANPFTDALTRSAIPLAIKALPTAVHDGQNIQARETMAWASLCGGLALANAKLGAVHGIAGPLGGIIPIPHGAACARLLPATLKINAQAIANSQNHQAQQRLNELPKLALSDPNATLPTLIDHLQQHLSDFNIPTLSTYGLTQKDIPHLAQKAQNTSSMKGNPVKLNLEQIQTIISHAL